MGIGYIRSDLVTLSQIHGDKCWPTVDKVSPCEEVCPIHMDIPSYVMALAQGQFKEAIDVVRETNPFPSICGRVCHHPCEEACNRTLILRQQVLLGEPGDMDDIVEALWKVYKNIDELR